MRTERVSSVILQKPSFPRRNNSPCSKYVILLPSNLFIPAILYLLARFLRRYIDSVHTTCPGPPTGGRQLGHFSPGPSLKGAPGGPKKGPLNTCLKDRYTLIEQSDLNTLIEQSKYSAEKQCSKLINKEIWLVWVVIVIVSM